MKKELQKLIIKLYEMISISNSPEAKEAYHYAITELRHLIDDHYNKNTIMKAKVLLFNYDDKSGFEVVRVYLEKDFEQAQKDLDLMSGHASDCKVWSLQDVEVFNT